MYKKIIVPVDLAHEAAMDKAIKTAADLSKYYEIPLCLVSITSSAPGPVARTPEEFSQRLDAFATTTAQKFGIDASAKAYTSHDPASDLDDTLLKAVGELGADLVVMATHVPGLLDYVWPSNGGKLAQHANASVFLVR